MAFMDAQRFRTPRGLEFFAKATKVDNRNALLLAMDAIFQQNATMWTEGIRNIVKATNSPTKFLLTDNPVTFYNEKAFPGPGSPYCTYPRDALLRWIGTRTIFPLDLEHCLIITHRAVHARPMEEPAARQDQRPGLFPQHFQRAADPDHKRALTRMQSPRINLILKNGAPIAISPPATKSGFILSVEPPCSCGRRSTTIGSCCQISTSSTSAAPFLSATRTADQLAGTSMAIPGAIPISNVMRRKRRGCTSCRLEWGSRRIGKSIGMSYEFHKRGQKKPCGTVTCWRRCRPT